MKVVGYGQINFWRGGSLWIGLAQAPTGIHAHHAIQLSLGLDGPVQLTWKEGSTEAQAVLVPSRVPHAFSAPGRVVATIFCEPYGAAGRKLAARFRSDSPVALPEDESARMGASLREKYAAGASDEVLDASARQAIDQLADLVSSAQSADRRITSALAIVDSRLDEPISLGEVAEMVGLSSARFRHLFVAETGVPFRPYLLWRRLQLALERGVRGSSWTEAAHAAGFADSAHLTRTFRKMLGVAPSALGRPQRGAGRAALARAAEPLQ